MKKFLFNLKIEIKKYKKEAKFIIFMENILINNYLWIMVFD